MFNPIMYGAEVMTVTGNVTLGYGPGQVLPPRELILNGGAAITVQLPPINSIMPAPPTLQQTIVGVGRGFLMTIRNNTAFAPTITPYSGDTLGDTITLSSAGSVQSLIASEGDSTWYKMAN